MPETVVVENLLVALVVALASLIAWLWNRMTNRLDGKDAEIGELRTDLGALRTELAGAVGKWDGHISTDETVHAGLRDDMAGYAMDSTRQHGELKDAIDTLRSETSESRRSLHVDVNRVRETVAEMRGQLQTANRYNEAILKALTGKDHE